MTLASLWSGHPEITELAIDSSGAVGAVAARARPRHRIRLAGRRRSAAATETDAVAIDRVTVTDGTISLFNLHDHVDDRIEGINADAVIGSRPHDRDHRHARTPANIR